MVMKAHPPGIRALVPAASARDHRSMFQGVTSPRLPGVCARDARCTDWGRPPMRECRWNQNTGNESVLADWWFTTDLCDPSGFGGLGTATES